MIERVVLSRQKDKIIEKNVELTLQAEGNWTSWPKGDPNWVYNNQTDRDDCQRAFRNLINVIRVCEDMKVN